MQVEQLRNTLGLADRKRQAQQWHEAIALYRQLEAQLTGQGGFHHNLALCFLAAGEPAQALVHVEQALAAQPALWQSVIIQARALKALGRWPEAVQLLHTHAAQQPQRGEFAQELATLALHELCHARLARQLVRPWLSHPVHGTDAALTDLMASLYDPTRPQDSECDTAQHINARALQFAAAHLEGGARASAAPARSGSRAHRLAPNSVRSESHSVRPELVEGPAATARHGKRGKPHRRLRVGLLSPLFNASPVYFFCSGALALLKEEFDLVFLSRSPRTDWATERLRGMAAQWCEVSDLPADELHAVLRQQQLDVLVDLGGWMDPVGLQALAGKPAARMYKWVGGQSLSTGLHSFDGFITDAAQTPVGFEPWYTEPLLRLPQGYVSYTAPPYLPAPVPAPTHAQVLGIVANPVKVSQGFLSALADRIVNGTGHDTKLPGVLRFIDRRYSQAAVQSRMRRALHEALAHSADAGRAWQLEFVAPASHVDYLRAVGALSEMLDTFPYNCGLTTIEALSLGVPCSLTLAPREGLLFCERHTLAHLQFLQTPGTRRKRAPHAKPGAPRQPLLAPGCPRSNHAALAASLAQLLACGSLETAV